MPTPDSPTPAPRIPAGREPAGDPASRVAIAALLHRLNGGLNNAALAFELVSTMGGSDGGDFAHTLGRGLAGVEQASRAATLLALLIDPSAAPPPSSAAGAYAQDVLDILLAHARRMGVSVESKLDIARLSTGNIAAAATADALLVGLATLERSKQSTTRETRTAE